MVRFSAAGLALLGLVALALWALGVGSSSRPWVSLGPKPDAAYWSAVRACKRVFPDAIDRAVATGQSSFGIGRLLPDATQ